MTHPEDVCDDCGGGNVVWSAPNFVWNATVRQPDKPDPMLCPTCFIQRAESTGFRGPWKVEPHDHDYSEP